MSHGKHVKNIHAPRSKFYHGNFGRLCPDLDPWEPVFHEKCPGQLDDYLLEFANSEMIEVPGKTPDDLSNSNDSNDLDNKFASNIPAGYTYFGQFIDHDITFDPTSSLMRQNDPEALHNFRTPRLDLDNIYGRGPHDQPYMYDPNDRAKLLVGAIANDPNLPDLPRLGDSAVIGDMRNDENAMVSQLQLAFILAHNRLVDRARLNDAKASDEVIFERARKTLRWLYQYIVWNDYIKRITIDEVYKSALQLEERAGGRKRWKCGLDDLYRWKHQPFIPVEFSVAAYRFGHSMVRNAYQTNNPARGFGNFAPIFDNQGSSNPDDLRGFRAMEAKNCIQWDWFLPMMTSGGPFPQLARKIDTKLANALSFLHEGPAGDPMNILAFRNLKRGIAMGLPAGTAVAKKFCLDPIKLQKDEPDSLWYYILREGQKNGGNTLGRVGSNIVCAVFAGLLKGDPCSYFNIEPCWQPENDPLLDFGQDNQDAPDWSLSAIIRLANLKVDGIGTA